MQLNNSHITTARTKVLIAKAVIKGLPNNQEMVLAHIIQMMEEQNPLKSIIMAQVIPNQLNMSPSLFRKILAELRGLGIISKSKVNDKLVYTLNK